MSEGNGGDIGHLVAMVQSVLVGQDAMRRELKADIAALRTDHGRKIDALAADVADLRSQMTSMREALTQYHSSVIGHGLLITELDERLRRVERHLGLSPAG